MEGEPLPTLAPMLERIMAAVVNVSTVTRIAVADHPLLRDPFFRHFFEVPKQERRESNSLGSGVIVDAERGIVLTNHHVIAKADSIRVTLQDGRTLEAELLGADPETDVAVLRLPTRGLPAAALRAIPLADSDGLRVGDFVVAIGNPFGLKQTVTSGIVSGLGRSGLGIEGYESFIQTDASINPGNSGGPLVNLRGELVGINTAILAPGGGNIGIGFAIPSNMARAIMEQILLHGQVRRGQFGVAVQDLTPELAAALGVEGRFGALVTAVEPDSAAAAVRTAGGRPGAEPGRPTGRRGGGHPYPLWSAAGGGQGHPGGAARGPATDPARARSPTPTGGSCLESACRPASGGPCSARAMATAETVRCGWGPWTPRVRPGSRACGRATASSR